MEFLKFSKMAFLIFFNSDYSVFSDIVWFEASLHDFLKFFEFLVFGCFGVIFEFLKFLKMAFLIFFSSYYSLFSDIFLFEASLHDFLKFFEFLVLGFFWSNFW